MTEERGRTSRGCRRRPWRRTRTQCGGPAVVEEVLDLAGDLPVGERGEEGESLEEPEKKEGGGRSESCWPSAYPVAVREKKTDFYAVPATDRGSARKALRRARGGRPMRCARRRSSPRATTDARSPNEGVGERPSRSEGGVARYARKIPAVVRPHPSRRPAGSREESLWRRELARDIADADDLV